MLRPRRHLRDWVRTASLVGLLIEASIGGWASVRAADPPGDPPPDYLPDWSQVSAPFCPLSPSPLSQPVLTAADVTDGYCQSVADPFLVRAADGWYMFFEAGLYGGGVIALASSADGLHWTYKHFVIDETWHTSFPCVFQQGGVYYMTTESAFHHDVRLYRAEAFPDRWVFDTTLLSGRSFTDPTIFRHGDLWWMLVSNDRSDTCYLYYSHSLHQGWAEHPLSPIVSGDLKMARPGGRVVTLSEGRLFRLAQDCSSTYGRALRVFQIDTLSTTDFSEHEIPESPILQADDEGWNADAMHQCDPWWVGDHWLAAVDGLEDLSWSIGIYRTAPPSSVPPTTVAIDRSGPALTCAPNPLRTSTEITGTMPSGSGSATRRLMICDGAGRVLYSRAVLPSSSASAPSGRIEPVSWNGTDLGGRPVPAGVYYCRLEQDGRAGAATRIVVVR
jgi:hypothetical protein